MDDTRALIAHLLRRTGFGPLPGQVEALVAAGYAAALDAVLAATPLPPWLAPGDHGDPVVVWLAQMRRPQAGIHEKMVWFWHGHLTTSVDVVDIGLVYGQHLLLREHALGNFRVLIRQVTTDPAMLQYLNGDGSTADAPNENYARELMELFTLGRGNYSQADVRSGAKALAGWAVINNAALYNPDGANRNTVTFLGRRGVLSVDDICDAVCDHPACAPFVAGRLHRFMVGAEPGPARRAELAALFRASGLEIRPLVEAILRHTDFAASRMTRPRYPVEWGTAAQAALGVDPDRTVFDQLGQTPFSPPNVAGWPFGPRWLSATAALARAGLALGAQPLDEIAGASAPVDAALGRCSLFEVSAVTRTALEGAARAIADHQQRAAALLSLCLVSPEFALA